MAKTANFVAGAMTENERRHQEALKRGSPKALRTARERAKKSGTSVTVTPSNAPTASVTSAVTGSQTPAAPKTGMRRYVLVLDCSGSMQDRPRGVWTGPTKAQGALQMAASVKDRLIHEDVDGKTAVTVVCFGNQVVVGQKNYKPKGLKDFTHWPNMGGTALRDAIVEGVKSAEENSSPEDTFCVIVVTDGQENTSIISPNQFLAEVRKRQDTGRFTFTFSVSPGDKDYIVSLGFAPGNIQEWTNIGDVEKSVTDGISAYTRAVSQGSTSITNFHQLNVTIDPKVLKTLPEIKSTLKVWAVDKLSRLDEFVQSHGVTFAIGKAFYQLTKNEKVEAGKEVLIVEKTFNPANGSKTLEAVYADGRKALGLPDGEIKKLVPQNLGNYEVYVQSTSNNRNLIPGTRVLYRI